MKEKEEILALDKKEKIAKKIFDKFIYIIEFILSAIFMIFFYKLICTKAYIGYYSKIYLGVCGLIGIGIAAIIIYEIIKNRTKIEKIFLAIAIPIGMAYLIFLAPTYAPDENAHIYRSYEISEATLFTGTNEDGYIRSNIPEFFIDNNHHTIRKYSDLNEAMKQQTDYNTKKETSNPAYSYFPTLYFPNTIMFLIGRIFSINGIIVLYLARIVNFIVFLICGYYTIKILPFGKILMMTYLLIPMLVHQAISLSADSITNTVALLFIAYTLYLYYKDDITRKNKILYAILAVLISLHKLVYFPIVLISLIFTSTKKMDKKQKIKFMSTVIIVGLIIGMAWITISSRGAKENDSYAIQNNVNSGEQVKYVLTHPFSYIKVLINTIDVNIENYYLWFMGFSMGWMDIGVRRILLDIYFILLIFSPFLEKHDKELNGKTKIIFLLVFLMTSVLILTALYVGHSGVGTDIVKGIQGRYFIPIVILLLLAMCGKERFIKVKYVEIIYPILITALNAGAVEYIIKFFI